MMRKGFFWIFYCVVFLNSCIDFKGAYSPDSYTPRTPHTQWTPKKEEKRLKPDVIKEDVSYLSKNGPLSLAELIDIALLSSPMTKQTWADARISAATYGQSLQNDFILATGQSDYNRSRSAEFSGIQSIGNLFTGSQKTIIYETAWGGSFNFSYLILDFGQTRASSRSALQALYNANYTHNRQIQTVIQSIMTDYYAYLSQKEQVKAAEADVENASISLDAVNEKLRMGLADLGDQIQAKTTLLQNQLTLVAQKQTLVSSYAQLANDLGVPSYATIELQNYPEEIHTFEIKSIDAFINDAIKYRPDILAVEAHVKSQEEALLAAKRKRFPTVSSSLNFGRTYYDINGTNFNDGKDWQLTFSLNFPLFQGFFLINGVKRAEANLKLAKAEYEQIQLSVIKDIVDYRSGVIYAAEALHYAKAFLEAAEEDFRINLKKYKVGTATILDVISAQTSVSDARSQFVNAEKNWYTSLANLAYGTGLLTLSKSDHLECLLKEDEF